MSNGRQPGRKSRPDRDGTQFVAIPTVVLDSHAYAHLSHPARSLLVEIARQYVRDNNGRLLSSAAYLSKRGWNSSDVITRAKRELLSAGFIFETVKGARPNKASWYAVTWYPLDIIKGYDAGARELFKRGAYNECALVSANPKLTREQIYKKWDQPVSGTTLRPSHGVESVPIAPRDGVEPNRIAPRDGAIDHLFARLSTPSHGHHLDIPSAASKHDCSIVYNNNSVTAFMNDSLLKLH